MFENDAYLPKQDRHFQVSRGRGHSGQDIVSPTNAIPKFGAELYADPPEATCGVCGWWCG